MAAAAASASEATAGRYELPIAALLRHTEADGAKTLYGFLDDAGRVVDQFTYSAFEASTAALAMQLVAYAAKPVLLVFPPGLDFIVAFFACLRARVVAVPVYPPRPGTRDLDMFLAVQRSCGAKLALTNTRYNWAKRVADIKSFLTLASDAHSFPAELEWMVADAVRGSGSSGSPARQGLDLAVEDTLAFLQYTSGSTSLPKGVILTHGNLAHNLTVIVTALKADQTCRVVSWLPQYHDMGLIGSLLGSMYCGGSAWIMSPLSFVKNPPLWLSAASNFKATHLQAPNFAYRLTVRKFKALKEPLANLDLSSVQHVFNAAEPIDPEAIDLFVATFAPYGFKREVLVPGYGLAEHTVYVCDGGKQRLRVDRNALEKDKRVVVADSTTDPKESRVIVGCGFAPPSVTLRIVDPQTLQALAEDCVGEIWITSPSKSSGYFGLEEKTASDLRAHLAFSGGADAENTDDARDYLRTGDMGFLHGSELFVCGRIKDMLIVRGRNIFPQDIEHSVEKVRGMRAGCSACFVVPVDGDSREGVCVVAEVREGEEAHASALIASVKQAVAREHGLSLHALVLLKAHSVPKTTSGKVSRYRARDAFLSGGLEPVLQSWTAAPGAEENDDASLDDDAALASSPQEKRYLTMAPDELLARFADEAAAMLEVEGVDVDAPLPELGFDSMMLTQFKGGIKNSLGCELQDEKLFNEEATLRALVNDLLGAPPPSATSADPGVSTAPGAASPTEGSLLSKCCACLRKKE